MELTGAKHCVVQGGDHDSKTFIRRLIYWRQLRRRDQECIAKLTMDCQHVMAWRQGKGYCTSGKIFATKEY